MELQLIQHKIHEVRGEMIMLDADLAELYSIETKRLKEAVKRNIKRFPPDFMFELSKEESEALRTQNSTSKRGGNRYNSFAFTEHGILMLSSVLSSERAIEMNIHIMRTFVTMRKFASNYDELAKRIGALEGNYSDVYEALHYLLNQNKSMEDQSYRKQIGY